MLSFVLYSSQPVFIERLNRDCRCIIITDVGTSSTGDGVLWLCLKRVMKVKVIVACLSITAMFWLSLAISGGFELSRTTSGAKSVVSSPGKLLCFVVIIGLISFFFAPKFTIYANWFLTRFLITEFINVIQHTQAYFAFYALHVEYRSFNCKWLMQWEQVMMSCHFLGIM